MSSLQTIIVYNLLKKGINISGYPSHLKELYIQYHICNVCDQFGLKNTTCHIIEHLPPTNHTYDWRCPECDGAPSSMKCDIWPHHRWGDKNYKCYLCNNKKLITKYCYYCEAHYCPLCYATHHIKLVPII